MTNCPTKFRCFLIYCSYFDILFSAICIISLGYYVSTCQLEDETVINQNTTLEQIKYFYKALKECGYAEESDIPTTDTVCPALETQVMPLAQMSLCLNFLLGICIQIMIRDKHIFRDKKYSRPVSLVSIPIGTFLSMSFAFIALAEYTSSQMCWLAYVVSEQRKSYIYLITVILTPIMVTVYKPLELTIFYLYGCSLFQNETGDEKIRKISTATKLQADTTEATGIQLNQTDAAKTKIQADSEPPRSTDNSTQI